MRLLTVNVGSTSVKLAFVDDGRAVAQPDDLDAVLGQDAEVDAVVHRVVHGGDRDGAVVVDDTVLDELSALVELAPLHQPGALDALRRCRAAWPGVPHVACFDTTFHRTIPAEAQTYALPERLRRLVPAYGFHGLAHGWAAGRLPDVRRLVVAHLGGGQSLCAVEDGRSVLTTMGFTPLDGLVMATRPGSIDPGALLWLAEHTDEDLSRVLEEESGLVGLAGTADFAELLDRRRAGEATATFAVDVWRRRLLRELGGCIAVLGGLDALAFTGGIGENSAEARDLVVAGLGWLPPFAVHVIEAREDLRMAEEATALLG